MQINKKGPDFTNDQIEAMEASKKKGWMVAIRENNTESLLSIEYIGVRKELTADEALKKALAE